MLQNNLILDYIRYILSEGGNARVRDRNTGKDTTYNGRPARSDQIYFLPREDAEVVLDRGKFISDFQNFFLHLNSQFNQETGKPLWPEASQEKLVGSASDAFSGSSRAMFNAGYDDDYILKTLGKSRMGDIDIMVPEDRKDIMWSFLEGKDSHDGAGSNNSLSWATEDREIVYIGQNDGAVKSKSGAMVPRKGPKGDQINCVFAYKQGDAPIQFVQVDFEFVPYTEETGMPTDLAVLGHYSAEEDMEVNVKGAYRAKLLQSIVRITTFLEAPIFSSATRVVPREEAGEGRGVPTAPEGSEEEDSKYVIQKGTKRSPIHTGAAEYTFSGDKGVRRRLLALGARAFGEKAYRELSTPVESKYVQDLDVMFEIIFKNPPEESDVRDLHSFRGLIRLIKKYIPEKAYEILMGIPGHSRATGLVQELFSARAQNQYANDDTSDEEYKTAALSIYLEEFPSFNTPQFQSEIESMKDSYYALQRKRRGV